MLTCLEARFEYGLQCTLLDSNNFPIIFNHFFTNPI